MASIDSAVEPGRTPSPGPASAVPVAAPAPERSSPAAPPHPRGKQPGIAGIHPIAGKSCGKKFRAGRDRGSGTLRPGLGRARAAQELGGM